MFPSVYCILLFSVAAAPLPLISNTPSQHTPSSDALHGLNDIVHVVMAGDVAVLPGLTVAASSLLNATRHPHRIRLHVLTTVSDHAIVSTMLDCALSRSKRASVEVLTFQAPESIFTGRAPPRLATELNYARLFLPHIFGASGKMIYLDADVIVNGDVVDLHDAALKQSDCAVAAVPRGAQRLRLAPSVASNAHAIHTLAKLGVNVSFNSSRRLVTTLQDFNAGVLVVDLQRWCQQNVTNEVLRWIRLNRALELYTRGSNPPLVLALADAFERLDSRWNCPANPKSTPASPRCIHQAAIVHLTGASKPWLDASQNIDARWAAKVTPRLLTCFKNILRFEPSELMPLHSRDTAIHRSTLPSPQAKPHNSPDCQPSLLAVLHCSPSSVINLVFCSRIACIAIPTLLIVLALHKHPRLLLCWYANKHTHKPVQPAMAVARFALP